MISGSVRPSYSDNDNNLKVYTRFVDSLDFSQFNARGKKYGRSIWINAELYELKAASAAGFELLETVSLKACAWDNFTYLAYQERDIGQTVPGRKLGSGMHPIQH